MAIIAFASFRFQPDYTTDQIDEILTLETNFGALTFPIRVRISQRVLEACYKSVPRPVWELRTYCICVSSLTVFIVLIFTTAIYDARRLFDNVSHCSRLLAVHHRSLP